MLALGPIFIICGLFEGSRGLFEGWIKAAVLFALTPLLAVLIGGATIAMLSPMLDSLAAAGGQVPLRLTTTLFLAAAVYCALMALVPEDCRHHGRGLAAAVQLRTRSQGGSRGRCGSADGPQTVPAPLSQLRQQAPAAIRACAPSSARPPPAHRRHSTAHRRRRIRSTLPRRRQPKARLLPPLLRLHARTRVLAV